MGRILVLFISGWVGMSRGRGDAGGGGSGCEKIDDGKAKRKSR